eukprot:5934641-Alexandrium_andersonii.AAC.1
MYNSSSSSASVRTASSRAAEAMARPCARECRAPESVSPQSGGRLTTKDSGSKAAPGQSGGRVPPDLPAWPAAAGAGEWCE